MCVCVFFLLTTKSESYLSAIRSQKEGKKKEQLNKRCACLGSKEILLGQNGRCQGCSSFVFFVFSLSGHSRL